MQTVVVLVFGTAITLSANSEPAMDSQDVNSLVAASIRDCPSHENLANGLTDECFESLNRVFIDRSLWEENYLVYYLGNHPRVITTSLNPRWTKLMVAHNDIALTNGPTWSHIFDGKIRARQRLVENVFKDETCRDLLHAAGVHLDLASRCNGRELFKYAAYLDVCTTAFNRKKTLAIRTKTGLTWYEHGLDSIRKFHHDAAFQRAADLTRQYVHTMWVFEQCRPFKVRPFRENLTLRSEEASDDFLMTVYNDEMQIGHDAALTISARTGNVWALQSSLPPFPSIKDPEYWEYLLNVNPILVHRWLAAGHDGMSLSKKEQFSHALEIYRLEHLHRPDISFDEIMIELPFDAQEKNKLLSAILGKDANGIDLNFPNELDEALANSNERFVTIFPWRVSHASISR